MSEQIANHPVFQEFEPWRGSVPANFSADFVGQLIDCRFSEALPSPTMVHTTYPAPSEETFEWLHLLQSILDAGDTFAMLELGAGFGRWIGAAMAAIRTRRPDLGVRFCAVEAEPDHFRWLLEHIATNDIPDVRVIRCAVGATSGAAHFVVGSPREWYGQAVVSSADYTHPDFAGSHTIEVQVRPLTEIIDSFNIIDFLDCDIQGAEREAIPSAIEAMSRRVKRAFIGTHSPEIDDELPGIFQAHGWRPVHLYRCGENHETPFGKIKFGDGVQCWDNPRLLEKRSSLKKWWRRR